MPTQENPKSPLNPITTKRIQKVRIGNASLGCWNRGKPAGGCQANLTIYEADPSPFGRFFNYCIALTWQDAENMPSCAIKQYLDISYHEIFSDFEQFASELEKKTLVIKKQKNNIHIPVKIKSIKIFCNESLVSLI